MPLSPGVWKNCEVIENWWTHSQNGNLGLAIRVAIPTEDGPQELIGTIWFTDKSAGLAYAQLRELGFEAKERSLNEVTENSLIGLTPTVVLEEGQRGIRIARFGVSGQKVKPPREQLDKLDKQLKNLKKKDASGEPTPDDSDIPF